MNRATSHLELKFVSLQYIVFTGEWEQVMANAVGRPIAPLVLSPDERAYLQRQVRRYRTATIPADALDTPFLPDRRDHQEHLGENED
jgi:hypothetical protein